MFFVASLECLPWGDVQPLISMKKILLSSYVALALASSTASTHAVLLAYNGFDGAATGFSSNGVPNDSGISLSYTDGNGNVLDTVAGSSGSFFADTMVLSSGLSSGTVYLSFIASSLNTNTTFRFDFISSDTTGVTIQSQFAGPTVNMAGVDEGVFFASGNPVIGGANTDLGSPLGTNFYVMALELDTGGVEGWYNPNLAAPGVADTSWSYAGVLDAATLDRLQPVFGGDFRFDEVRVGTSFADVAPFTPIPEPTSAALLLGGLGLLALRRRR